MTKLITLSNIGTKGLNSDVQPWELPVEFITYGKNFRVNSGAVETAGSFDLWATDTPNFYPGYLIHVGLATNDFWLMPGRTAVKVFDGSAFSDVSSAVGYAGLGAGDERLWTGGMLGAIPIINNPQHFPEYWSPQATSQIMQPLLFDAGNTWSAKGYSCKVMRVHKNFLFALNLHEGTSDFPDSYRWSHPADINGLPFSWDETDLSSLASKESLGGDGGEIIDGLTLRDAFVIYSQRGIDVLDYTGDEFVFRRRSLSTTMGLLSSRCIVEVKTRHFFIGDGDIFVNDGNSIQSILHDRIKKRFNSSINSNYVNSFVVRSDSNKEIWFCIPEGSDNTDTDYVDPNIAYIYNWRDDTWAVKDLPQGTTYAQYGAFTPETIAWDSVAAVWNDSNSKWDSQSDTPLNDTVIGVSSDDGTLTRLDVNTTTNDLDAVLERTDYPLEGHKPVTTITCIYPYFEGSGDVSIEFGSQDFAGSSIRWKPAVTFTVGQDRKVDIRTTGELHCWRFKSIGSTPFKLSGMAIEYVNAGLR